MRTALQTGKATMEDYAKYRDMSPKQKKDFTFGIAANFADDFRQKAELQRRQSLAQTNLATARAASELADVGTGGGVGEIETNPLMLGEKPIPGLAIVSRKGTRQFQIVPTGELNVQVDPKTGKAFYSTKSGPKEMKASDPMKEAIASQITGAAPSPAPAPTPVDQALNTIQGGTRPAAGPTPALSTAGTAVATGSPVRVSSVAEAKALPPGTLFIDPQGIVRRR
jgi:hypothetical protein